jgi:hypothetical protein
MKKVLPEFPQRSRFRRSAILIAIAAGLLVGCDTVRNELNLPPTVEAPTYYRPSNVYVYSLSLPASLRRVALLPMTTANAVASQQAGTEELEPVLQSELEKTKRFEVVTLSGDDMRQLTGQSTWRADEPLPLDFFDKLQRSTGCDAVMFSQLTKYQPYQPLAVGWKLSLASKTAATNAQPQLLWSVDEVLDAGESQVAKAARTYYMQHVHTEQTQADPGTILRSPGLFGRFSLEVLFATLPERDKD